MSNKQEALLAIALSQSKILEISYLMQAEKDANWKENAVIRRPDGTFLKWEPGGTNPLKDVPVIPRKLKYLDTPTGTSKISKEDAESMDVKTAQEWSQEAIKEMESLADELSNYQKALLSAANDPTKQRMRNNLKKNVDKIMDEMAKTSFFERDMEGLTRSNRFNEYLGPVRAFAQRVQNSAKTGLTQKVGETGQATVSTTKDVMSDDDKKKIALAAAGVTALTALTGVAINRGYAKGLRKMVGSLSESLKKNKVEPNELAEIAKQIGLSPNRLAEVLPEVKQNLSIIDKVVANAEDTKIIGKAIRRYRAGNVRRNVKQLDVLNKQARQKAEEQLAKLPMDEFNKAWQQLDLVFGHRWDNRQGWAGVQEAVSKGKGKPSSKGKAAPKGKTAPSNTTPPKPSPSKPSPVKPQNKSKSIDVDGWNDLYNASVPEVSVGTALLLNAIASKDFKVFDDILDMLPEFAGEITEDDLSGMDSLMGQQGVSLQTEMIDLMVDCN